MRALTWLLGPAWDARAWRPQHARLLWSHVGAVPVQPSDSSGIVRATEDAWRSKT